MVMETNACAYSCLHNYNLFSIFYIQETDDGIDASLESSQDDEGNKDAARATLRIKEKLDGYEAGEIRSVQGQVIYW